MEITPDMVKKLRIQTDAGMLDCKKALQEADGDFEQAQKILKEKGLVAAGKRADRATAEGKVFICIDAKRATILEITCETDFVAKTDQFIKLGNDVAKQAHNTGANAVTPELEHPVKEAVSILKENLVINRIKTINLADDEVAVSYLHDGGAIGVVVCAKVGGGDITNPVVIALLNDCAMHVAAYSPLYLTSDQVDAKYIADQKEIFIAQTIALGKPENMAAGIAEGKLKKHLSEVSFLEQGFVKEPKFTVQQMVDNTAKELGITLQIVDFVNFRVGV
jgi:elongation factor Ts